MPTPDDAHVGRTVLFLDVDGTLSPLGDNITDTWGDLCNITSPSFAHVQVSPTLLTRIAQMNVDIVWATDWEQPSHTFTADLLGRPAIDQLPRRTHPTWWKAAAVRAWLTAHPHVRRVAWCDDDLRARERGRTRRATLAAELTAAGLDVLLIAPTRHIGLTPAHLRTLEEFTHPDRDVAQR